MSGFELNSSWMRELATELVNAAKRAGELKGLYGAQAGIIIRRLKPDFRPEDYAVGSVREFIQKYITELHIVRRTPSDVIYGLVSWPALDEVHLADAQSSSSDFSELWRIWVSPSSPYSIALRVDGSGARAIRKGTAEQGEVEIAPLPPQSHQEIARDFLRNASLGKYPEAGSALSHCIENPGSDWWNQWAQILRRLSRELYGEWFVHRQMALESALKGRLEQQGLKPEIITDFLLRIRSGRELRHREKIAHQPRESFLSPLKPEPSEPIPTAATLIRDLTSSLGERELRKICLLLALIVDSSILGKRG